MSILDNFKQAIQRNFENRRQERLRQEQLQQQIRDEENKQFQVEFKKAIEERARIKAQREAAELTGLAKLRAINKIENKNPPSRMPFMQKLGDMTKKNIAQREANLERTRRLREEAARMRQERFMKKRMGRGSLY